jgi:GGDEF domain-containing protein
VGLTALVSLTVDAFAGIVVGLAGAAALIAAKRLTGRWDAGAFELSLIETLALVAVGGAGGRVGAALRPRGADEAYVPRVLAPAFGSLGLLPQDVAMLRLEEEVDRARAHRRPLTVVIVDSEVVKPAPDDVARDQALRAVARIFESRVLDRDLPFAISTTRLGAVLPETSALEGWVRVGAILDAIAAASYTSRGSGGRRPVTDALQVHVGLAELGPDITSADALLDAATAGAEQQREAVGQEPT